MKAVDIFRCKVMHHISSVPSFRNSWISFSTGLDSVIGSNPTSQQIFDIGENLSNIFRLNATSGRSQASVAGGGAAWECFATWYFNLIFWGTNVVAVRQNKRFVPSVLYDSFCVTIANHKTNTESDIVVYSIPDVGNIEQLKLEDIDELIRNNIQNVDTSIVQCKTNWNDNAQIPMLWDLIYNSNSFRIPNVHVGTGGFSPNSFRKFCYSFVTVPSGNDLYESDSLCVLRVKNLSGGNYWGKKTEQGVCGSLSNFFGRNFSNHFQGSVQSHIGQQQIDDTDYYRRFRTLDF
jgi:hypothetical protein